MTFELRSKHEDAINRVDCPGFACLSEEEMMNEVVEQVVKFRGRVRVFAEVQAEINEELDSREIFLASRGGIGCLQEEAVTDGTAHPLGYPPKASNKAAT
jgi:hypothetical protein